MESKHNFETVKFYKVQTMNDILNIYFQKISNCNILLILFLIVATCKVKAQTERGYYDAPYIRYEANLGVISGATVTPKSFSQIDLQSEASDQICVNMSNTNASVEWTITEVADGLVIRYSVPDGQSATIGIYNDNTKVTTLTLTSTWSWEYLWSNGNSNNVGVVNQNPKMRFDEVRYKFPSAITKLGKLKLVRESGNLHIDFAELEAIPQAVTAPVGSVIYSGNGSDLQTFINSNGGKKIFVPTGVYNVNRELYFGISNTSLFGSGMWYTQINFTSTIIYKGGLVANAANISFADLYLTTNLSSRSNSYKAINGVYTSTSTIKNIWAEHFECGAWIAQYNTGGPSIADGFKLSNCRFRNNYADGINLCKGTSNAIVEHCNFRNNGDDDQAIWCANDQECINNTFRYNTSENCWRASGLAIYGGKNNKAYNLIIKDNLEAGIRISNSFPGVGFNSIGSHDLYNITLINCGTFNDLYNNPVGAIDIFCSSTAGTQVRNVQFYNIDILDSKNDAILIKKTAGDGIYNLSFKAITANGTAKEYPYNNSRNSAVFRGYFVQFTNSPNGNGTYCNMNYSNRGGTAISDERNTSIGAFSWVQDLVCTPLATKEFTANSIFIYPNPSSNYWNLSSSNEIIERIQIVDVLGKTIQIVFPENKDFTIDTSGLNSGIYYAKVSTAKKTSTLKVIKK